MNGSKVAGIISLVLVGAIVADLVAHQSGASSLFTGTNHLLTSGYKAASGAYA